MNAYDPLFQQATAFLFSTRPQNEIGSPTRTSNKKMTLNF